MSDKLVGRIELTQESSSSGQLAQHAWTPQAMRPLLDKTADRQMPSEFGNLQLSDDHTSRQLKAHAGVSVPSSESHYKSEYDHPQTGHQHHDRLSGSVKEHNQANSHQKTDYLVGETQIPASRTGNGVIASESLTATMPASAYSEGQHFSGVLAIPAEKGKHHFYNGLADAHYENGHLYGIPVHMEHGKMTSHLDHAVDIPLHHTQKK